MNIKICSTCKKTIKDENNIKICVECGSIICADCAKTCLICNDIFCYKCTKKQYIKANMCTMCTDINSHLLLDTNCLELNLESKKKG